jgi:hypothetical protein
MYGTLSGKICYTYTVTLCHKTGEVEARMSLVSTQKKLGLIQVVDHDVFRITSCLIQVVIS